MIDSPYEYDGRPVPRVSQILSVFTTEQNKDRLAAWAAFAALEDGNRDAWREIRDNAAKIGTQTHKIIECILQKQDIDFEPMPEALNACNSWVEWRKVRKEWVFLDTEAQFVNEQYGGTVDAVCSVEGKLWVVDWKTGSKITTENKLQAAAYTLLAEQSGQEIEGAKIVRLGKKANMPAAQEFTLEGPELQIMRTAFVSLVSVWYAINANKYKARAKTVVKAEMGL